MSDSTPQKSHRSSITDSHPNLVERLKSLGHQVPCLVPATNDGYGLYSVDLSEWKLRFSAHTPLIWVTAKAASDLSTTELFESLRDVAKERKWQDKECLVLLDSNGQELKAQATRHFLPRLIIIDTTDQENLRTTRSFTGRLLDLICEQVPISILAPYQVSRPVEGSEFFGREREIAAILKNTSNNYAVVGIRRIGKTSLVKEVRRRLLDQGEKEERVVWLDCSTISDFSGFAREIVRQLHIRDLPRLEDREHQLFHLPDFFKRMFHFHKGRIHLFLDEADKFPDWAHSGERLFRHLRESVNAGHSRFIIDGFQTLLSKHWDNQSAFFQVSELIEVRPFELRETEEMIFIPMEKMRVRLENRRELAKQIQNDTQGHPILVQHFCQELIKNLRETQNRILSPESLSGIYTGDKFRSLVVNVFRENVIAEDKVLVYALLSCFPDTKESFIQEEMFRALEKKGVHYTTQIAERIDRSCERLVLAGVFIRDGTKYRFALPVFPRTLRANHHINYLLALAKKEMGL